MKALTIKQPFASLIAHGIKDIENRTWRTNHRGRIYIHAGADPKVFSRNISDEQLTICRKALAKGKLPHVDMLPLSAIIGEVDIVDCVINHPSIWAEKSWLAINQTECPPEERESDYLIYNWVLANPVIYDKPILNVKGKLSFWEFERTDLKY